MSSEDVKLGEQIARSGKYSSTTGDDNPMPESPARVKLWRANDLAPSAQPKWLAKFRLPLASVALLVGDEGIGKSLFWVWLVAFITTGKAEPKFGIPARAPGRVTLVITEDDWSTTVLPRLIVAGADLGLITVICTERDGSGAPIFPRDIALVGESDPVLVVVDAWLDTVSSGLSVRDPQQARQALHPWREVATQTGAAVLLLTHTNRVASGNPRDRYGATAELRKKARLTLFAQRDEDGNLVVGPEKTNISAPVLATTFGIAPVQHFESSDDHDGMVPVLEYRGESSRTAAAMVADSYEQEHGGGAKRSGGAAEWIKGYLSGKGGEDEASNVIAAGEAAGYSAKTLKNDRSKVAASTRHGFGPGSIVVWTLSIDPDKKDIDPHTSPSPDTGTYGSMAGSMQPETPTEANAETAAGTTKNLPKSDTPGGLAGDSPGQTDRMKRALANAEARQQVA
ncbi:Uncharacterised protein [Mycobacteroides abscessus]|uniref:AAA family ATPase n=1 Tax=Mycobacteroides abscessus TaxID=36809 RepID=UPI0005E490DD|nr:AAA family ATPase [Mycobacteroides abscessus]PVB14464.1 hypothetical protein DDJ68_13225 [Mycobacteroides abscessus]RIR93468.1 hypothetical protein D2E57_13505 [Mycobacteroides abscessus]CPX22354.1 Uncharacterised protein [Mycobacteroides abscessus]CRG62195.1 Uncharacterised protein [Mycobacteroides abscessus]SKZ74077.1 Uncharacterised protein [Mycobacteroides abscessus subsp. abscessus]